MSTTPRGIMEPAGRESEKKEELMLSTEEKILIRTAKPWLAAKEKNTGDTITGKVVYVHIRPGQGEFKAYPVVTINTGVERYTAVHCFHELLKKAMFDAKPGPGDDITVMFEGEMESKNLDKDGKPRTYYSYVVIVNGQVMGMEEFSFADNTGNDDMPF